MQEAPAPAWKTLLDWWNRSNAGIQTRSATPNEVAALEARYEVVLPQSFRDYIACACPVSNPSWDNELLNWWPFESLKSVTDDYNHPLSDELAPYRDKLILFADFMIWAYGWAINCAAGPDYGKVAIISGDNHEGFVAETFDAFVLEYVRDPRAGSIHG